VQRKIGADRIPIATLLSLAALLLHFAVPSAVAETLPTRGSIDPRVRTAIYDPDEVYRLYGYVGYSTELVFEPGETFVGQGGGDLDGIAFGAHDNQLVIKPHAANVATNFVVYTTRRAYRFEFSVVDRRPEPSDDVMYVVRFTYPRSQSAAAPPTAQLIDEEFERARRNRPLNHDYWFCGSSQLKPTAASDDGVHTRLTFDPRTEWPAVFVKNDDGSEALLHYSVHGSDLLVHRTARRLILRRGKLVGCVVNAGFDGSGLRLPSGTVSPDVLREPKQALP
jgi:type IV secretion system protein VirB9